MREVRNEKAFTLCKKRSAKEKTRACHRKIVRSRTRNEERREKVDFTGQKNVGEPSKNRPKSGSKRGKAGKTEILERKRWGGGVAKKRALLPILQCY